MSGKKKEQGIVISQRQLAEGIYDMTIRTSLAKTTVPGQFICIYPKDRSTLLPRPISVCEVLGEDVLRIVYRVAGQGTKEFSSYAEGESIAVMGPIGNGFPLEEGKNKKVFLMGGGIGVPPILELSKALLTEKEKKQIIMGYRNQDTFLVEEFAQYGTVYLATEDGSAGTKGNVMDAIRAQALEAEVIYACGPMPMLRAIKAYASQKGIPAYISLEEHMACGVGACLGCVVKTKEVDHHSHVRNARICTEGPVFEASQVEI